MQEHSPLPDRLTAEQREQVEVVLGESEVALISCLYWRMDIERVIPCRRLADSYVYVPVAGRLAYRVATQEGVVGPGEFMMVAEGVEHEARLAAGCDYFEAFALHAHAYTTHGQSLFAVFREPIGRLQPLSVWLEQLELLTHLMGVDQDLGRRFGEPWLRHLLLHQLMQGRAVYARPAATDERLWRALYYLMRHYAERLTVGELAARAGVSEVHFRNLFRRHTGQTPKAYIQQLRLRKARALLQTNPLLTVKEVAAQTGFGDAHHFHAVFKRAYGVTPATCRRGRPEGRPPLA